LPVRIDASGTQTAVSYGVVPGEFVRVCLPDELVDDVPRAFLVDDPADPNRVLVRTRGELFALSGICPHEQADLAEGVVERGVLWCPVHSSGFDCRTGAVIHPPAREPLKTYQVRLEDGSVFVRLGPGP
jgi:3-phenylpropionate/trans-cinnamate dioxygenase ferredoxin component